MCHSDDRIFGAGRQESTATAAHLTFRQADGHLTPYVLTTPGGTARGTVLLFLDAIGMSPFYEDIALELAGHGYRVAVPDYFSRLTSLTSSAPEERRSRRKREMDDLQVLADAEELADHLVADPAGGSLSVIGFCLGGMFALTFAAQRKDVVGTVAFYGFVGGQAGRSKVDAPRAIDLADGLDLPMLLHWGTADGEAYRPEEIEQFVAASTEAGGRAVVSVYEDATHAFLKALVSNEDTPNRRASLHAWPATLDFLAACHAEPVTRRS